MLMHAAHPLFCALMLSAGLGMLQAGVTTCSNTCNAAHAQCKDVIVLCMHADCQVLCSCRLLWKGCGQGLTSCPGASWRRSWWLSWGMDGEKRWTTLSMIRLQLLPLARYVTQARPQSLLPPPDQQGDPSAEA